VTWLHVALVTGDWLATSAGQALALASACRQPLLCLQFTLSTVGSDN